MLSRGTMVKIITSMDFCEGVYNNTVAKIVDYYFNHNYIVNLINYRDIERVESEGYATKNVIIHCSYCFIKGNKLKI